jgi:hypothetical protein
VRTGGEGANTGKFANDYSTISLFHHSNIPIFHHSIIPIFHHSNIPIFHHSNIPMLVLAYLLLPFKNEMVAATASTELVAANI